MVLNSTRDATLMMAQDHDMVNGIKRQKVDEEMPDFDADDSDADVNQPRAELVPKTEPASHLQDYNMVGAEARP